MNNLDFHPTAEVGSSKIGKGTTVWQFAIILERAQIGSNCNINCHVFIENDVLTGITLQSNLVVKFGTE